jgi:serine/threonine protein kinase/DNA polymerase III delta prime subunit
MAVPRTLGEGRYKVKDVLGRSEHSTVYECFDPEREERVAIKVLSVSGPNPEINREMFKREVGALTGFEHLHLVQMLDYMAEEDAGRLNIVLEMVPGGKTLEALITDGAGTATNWTLRWRLDQALGLLQVLGRAHGRGVIHRDVKLRNVLLDQEQRRLKLVDFGIARILENYGRGTAGQTLRDFYSRPFAAPEQVLLQATSFPADLYAFGVVLASLLAWRLPDPGFTADSLSSFLADFRKEHADQEGIAEIEALLRRLLSKDPASRPKSAEIEKALRVALDGLVERTAIPVIVTNTPRQKARSLGLKIAMLDDVNHGLRIAYEPERDGKPWSILCIGRQGQARLVADPEWPGKLKVVDYFQPHPTAQARARERAVAAPFLLTDGEGSGEALIEFAWEDHQRREVERAEQAERESMLSIASFVLQKQRERLDSIRVRYTLDDESVEAKTSVASLEPWKQKLKSLSTEPPPKPARSEKVQVSTGEFLTLKILSVQAGHTADAAMVTAEDEDGAADAVPPDFEEMIGPDSTFAFNGKNLGTAYGYDHASRKLTLKLQRAMSLPMAGELTCEDVAQRTSLDRQEKAITTFKTDGAINPRLSKLLMNPGSNTLDEREPLELVQAGLEPADDVADLVSRAMAARDFFLLQGPPGTGKTTFITELICQLLRKDPFARILLTSQANEAVNNAVEAVREQDQKLGGRWRVVRDKRQDQDQSVPTGFDCDFAAWAKETSARCEREAKNLSDSLSDAKKQEVAAALDNWRKKLGHLPDVKQDYAESVQVWAMTLLRVPTLWQRMRSVRFDYVIIDEAARATTAEMLVALITGARFLLVGDHRQLPPFFDNETKTDLRNAELDVERASKSLFEELFEKTATTNRATLRRQFRMHRSIGKLVADLYYPEIGIEHGVPDDKRQLDLTGFNGEQRVFWLDVAEGRERKTDGSTSRWNHEEVVAIEKLLSGWEDELRQKGASYTVGVIAAYDDQREKLLDRIRPKHPQRWKALRIRIDTVDAFQGKQDDIMLYSMVRANTSELRFIADRRRLNVAFSRAKRLLVIVGHRDTAKLQPDLHKVVDAVPTSAVLASRRKP